MRIAENWSDYALLDCSDGERLERWGEVLLIRPDPQVIWKGGRQSPLWREAHARYVRASSGGGQWEFDRQMPTPWRVAYGALLFGLKPMGFKHTGLFPEQAVNWEVLAGEVRRLCAPGLAHNQSQDAAQRPRVLNLFAYTGGATLACLAAGAHVTHVDAAKGMVLRARENAEISGLGSRPVRWIVEDCVKFAQREVRRENLYDIILMDPPSYGRGPGGEVWQLAAELDNLLTLCARLLQPRGMLLLNSYSAELSPAVMHYALARKLTPLLGGTVVCDEIGLRCQATDLSLPCGSTAVWRGEYSGSA
ncbi:MAG: class I SAM-dependent methyltransferase [Oscillospiraceae bacterium]|jgi:23S rRNA (cytosine1962-C5)-methyltransferase|nr:class I SAM-dependent methyltransferase [Oscillospiraceae bacterium]